MALSASTVFEVRTTGSDSNGGGFVTGASGTDYSQQNAAQYALTGLTTAAANAVILTSSAAAAMVGNLVNITGGTNFTVGVYQITAVSVGVSITVDRNCTTAAGSAGVGNIGGALASPGYANGLATSSGQIVYVKYSSSVYPITTTTANVSNGPLGSTTAYVIGYDTTRTVTNADANRPTLQMQSVSSIVGVSSGRYVANLIVDCNSNTGSGGIGGGSSNRYAIRCTVKNFKSYGFSNLACLFCSSEGGISGATAGFDSPLGSTYGCVAVDCSCPGFNGPSTISCCVALRCTSGIVLTNDGAAVNCSAVSCTSTGIDLRVGAGGRAVAVNCIVYGCGAYGFDGGSSPAGAYTFGCAAGSNTSGNFRTTLSVGSITLTADPFTNKTGNDLSLNNTAGGGLLLRGLRFPALPFGLSTTDFGDIGPFQHQDAGGGSSGVLLVSGF